MIKLKDIVLDLLNEGIKLKDVKDKWVKDKPDLTDAQINFYWNKINAYNNAKDGKDKVNLLKTPFSDIEKIVDSSFSKETSSIKKQDADYKEYAKKNGLVVYDQNNMMVVRSDSKESCVILGKGEKWCISRGDTSNMYYGYKYGLGYPTIYYSYDFDKLEKNKDDVNGILVIMVINNENYVGYKVADRDNYENSGTKNVDWNYISKLQPKLSSIENIFEYTPISKEEKDAYIHVLRIGKSKGNDRLELYDKLDFDKKSLYIDVNQVLTSNMFKITPKELQEKYIKMGGELSYENMIKLPPNLRKVLEETIEKIIESGLYLNPEKYNYLVHTNNDSLLIKNIDKLLDKEYRYLSEDDIKILEKNNKDEIILYYINKIINKNYELDFLSSNYLVKNNLDDILIKYIDKLFVREKEGSEFNLRGDNLGSLDDHTLNSLIKYNKDEILNYFINKKIEVSVDLDSTEFRYLFNNKKDEIILNYINKKMENKPIYLKDIELNYLSHYKLIDVLKKYFDKKLEQKMYFSQVELMIIFKHNLDEYAYKFIDMVVMTNNYLNQRTIDYLKHDKRDDILDYYFEKRRKKK